MLKFLLWSTPGPALPSSRFLPHRHPVHLEPPGDGLYALPTVSRRVNSVYLVSPQRCSTPSRWFPSLPKESPQRAPRQPHRYPVCLFPQGVQPFDALPLRWLESALIHSKCLALKGVAGSRLAFPGSRSALELLCGPRYLIHDLVRNFRDAGVASCTSRQVQPGEIRSGGNSRSGATQYAARSRPESALCRELSTVELHCRSARRRDPCANSAAPCPELVHVGAECFAPGREPCACPG